MTSIAARSASRPSESLPTTASQSRCSLSSTPVCVCCSPPCWFRADHRRRPGRVTRLPRMSPRHRHSDGSRHRRARRTCRRRGRRPRHAPGTSAMGLRRRFLGSRWAYLDGTGRTGVVHDLTSTARLRHAPHWQRTSPLLNQPEQARREGAHRWRRRTSGPARCGGVAVEPVYIPQLHERSSLLTVQSLRLTPAAS